MDERLNQIIDEILAKYSDEEINEILNRMYDLAKKSEQSTK